MFEYHRGAKLSIWLRTGARESWDDAEGRVPPNKKACPAQFRARIEYLATSGWLRSPDHMNHEDNGIFAIKANCGLRAYGWFDQMAGRRAFIISHVILKKRQGLYPADRDRAERERAAFRREQSGPMSQKHRT